MYIVKVKHDDGEETVLMIDSVPIFYHDINEAIRDKNSFSDKYKECKYVVYQLTEVPNV